jgi:hypothetical protein
MPDHEAEFVVLFCAATASGARESSTTREKKRHFAVESTPTNSIKWEASNYY